MTQQLCIQCKKYPPFVHPRTGHVFKLCAECGWKVIAHWLKYAEHDEYEPIDPISKEPDTGLLK